MPETMRFRRLCEFTALFCICLSVSGLGFGWDKLDIRAEQDTAYLPLRYVEIDRRSTPQDAKEIAHHLFIQQTGIDSANPAIVLSISNPHLTSDMPAMSTLKCFPSGRIIDNDHFYLTVSDCRLFSDLVKDCQSLAGVGYRSDSAFLFTICSAEENTAQYLYLCQGKDTTQNGIWEPEVYFNRVMDYDFDGRTEAFVYLTSRREIGPRRLFCVELETMKIEWTLDIASQLINNRLYGCGDSANPAIVFVTGGPGQGWRDANYRDDFTYLSIVNNKGELLFNKVIAACETKRDLIPAEVEVLKT